jgi:hypothetical protein
MESTLAIVAAPVAPIVAVLPAVVSAPVATLHKPKPRQVTAKQGKTPALVVKLNRSAYIEITKFHRDLFGVAFKHADLLNKAVETQRAAVSAMISIKYGEAKPSYIAFRADRAALRALSLERGLVDDQYIRKVYNACLIGLYGSLPASETANAKRQPKSAKGNAKAKKAPDLLKGITSTDAIGQVIAKFGVGRVLDEVRKILSTSASTKTDASALDAIARHYSSK